MFSCFSAKARLMIFGAWHLANKAGEKEIKPEHIFLSILKKNKQVVVQFLNEPTVDYIKQAVEKNLGTNRVHDYNWVSVTYSPQSKKIIDIAHELRIAHGQKHIELEHVLYGIVQEETSGPAELLIKYEINISRMQEHIRTIQPSSS